MHYWQSSKGYTKLDYDTIRDAMLMCNQKLTGVSLIYRKEPTNKKWKKKKNAKVKNGYAHMQWCIAKNGGGYTQRVWQRA